MNVEVVAIGSEILSGFTINSNAAYISRQLFDAGIPTAYHTVLPDGAEALKKGLEKALKRSRFVIATGGLGPTCDDITRQVAAELFHSSFTYSQELADELFARYGDRLSALEDQATVPVKAEIIKNSLGTAPGFIFNEGGATLFLLPGVPPEMKKMFHETVLPYLCKHYSAEKRVERRWMHFFHLIESQVDPVLREIQARYPSLEMGIYPVKGKVSVCFSMSEGGNPQVMESAFEEMDRHFGKYRFEASFGEIEEAIQTLFVERGLTLSLAESCTGGAMAAQLTRRAGASQYFLGSLVTYSNQLKQSLLHVSEETLEKYGAVSQEVVEEMVVGLIAQTGSDYGVAVSGIAGPTGGTEEKPVGTVWAAIGKKGEKPHAWKMRGYGGSREMVIDYSINIILGSLYKTVKFK